MSSLHSINFAPTFKRLLAAGIVSTLAACGGGTSTTLQSGKVIDGVIVGATVTLDVNDDRICDANEQKNNSTTTNQIGDFVFSADKNPGGGQHMTCSTGGVDLSSGIAIVGTFKAPAGSTVITALTSLVQAKLDAAYLPGVVAAPDAATVSAAANTVATNLNLVNTNLLTTNPVAVADSNPLLIQTTAAVTVMLASTAAAVTATATDTGTSAAVTSAVNAAVYQSALQALLTQVNTPLSGDRTLASLSNAVVAQTVTNAISATSALAASNSTVPAYDAVAKAMPKLSPSSVAAFVSATVNTSVDKIINTLPSTLAKILPTVNGVLTPAAGNPIVAAAAQAAKLATSAALASDLLTTTVAAGNTDTTSIDAFNTQLKALSDTVQTQLSSTTTANNAQASINAAIDTAQTKVSAAIPKVQDGAVAAEQAAAAAAAKLAAQAAQAAAVSGGVTGGT